MSELWCKSSYIIKKNILTLSWHWIAPTSSFRSHRLSMLCRIHMFSWWPSRCNRGHYYYKNLVEQNCILKEMMYLLHNNHIFFSFFDKGLPPLELNSVDVVKQYFLHPFFFPVLTNINLVKHKESIIGIIMIDASPCKLLQNLKYCFI